MFFFCFCLAAADQLVSTNNMMLLVFILASAVLEYYIGQRKLVKNNKFYDILDGNEEVAMVSYQTQKE